MSCYSNLCWKLFTTQPCSHRWWLREEKKMKKTIKIWAHAINAAKMYCRGACFKTNWIIVQLMAYSGFLFSFIATLHASFEQLEYSLCAVLCFYTCKIQSVHFEYPRKLIPFHWTLLFNINKFSFMIMDFD